MSCADVDLKAYVLGEVERLEQLFYEQHLESCSSCRGELDRLRLLRTALFSVPDEEPPRRIAFVSDKVFEPRWWQTIWWSGPVLGLASAAMLACAILVHAYIRRAPVVGPPVDRAQMERRINAEVSRRVQTEVAQAVADMEKRQSAIENQVLAAAEKRYEAQRRADLIAAQETINLYKNQMGRMMVAANYSMRSGQ